MARRFELPKAKAKDLRLEVLERADWRCLNPLCKSPRQLEVDHVVPRSQGGPDTPENLAPLCKICHTLKGDGVLLVVPDGRGGFGFTDLRRRGLCCEACEKLIEAGALVGVPTPNGGRRWVSIQKP